MAEAPRCSMNRTRRTAAFDDVGRTPTPRAWPGSARGWRSATACARARRCRIRVWARCEPSKTQAPGVARRRRRPGRAAEAVLPARAGVRPRPGRPAPTARDAGAAGPADRADHRRHARVGATGARDVRRELGVSVELRADARRLRRLLPSRERRIAINTAVAVNQQAAALVHELAHALVRLDHHTTTPSSTTPPRSSSPNRSRNRLRVPGPGHRRQLDPLRMKVKLAWLLRESACDAFSLALRRARRRVARVNVRGGRRPVRSFRVLCLKLVLGASRRDRR